MKKPCNKSCFHYRKSLPNNCRYFNLQNDGCFVECTEIYKQSNNILFDYEEIYKGLNIYLII